MNMKKLLAGVVAGALAVTSLATVGVFAEDAVITYQPSEYNNTLKFDYSKTVEFRDHIEVSKLFGDLAEDPDANTVLQGKFSVGSISAKPGYYLNAEYLKELQNALNQGVMKTTDFQITVNGYTVDNEGKKGNNVTVTTGCNNWTKDWSDFDSDGNLDETPSRGNFIELVGPKSKTVEMGWSFLNLAKFYTKDPENEGEFIDGRVESFTITTSFVVNIGAIKVNTQGIDIKVVPSLDIYKDCWDATTIDSAFDFTNHDSVDRSASATLTFTEKASSGMIGMAQGVIYTFEGIAGNPNPNFIVNGDARGENVPSVSLGRNLLRWVNDNIVQNKGAKLRITLLPASEGQDALDKGLVDLYETDIYNGKNVLVPGRDESSSLSTNDVMIGVNLPNTSKLQQAADIKDYVVEFDWDKLVSLSTSTISGNVDSIAIRINPDSPNVKNLYKNGAAVVIDKLEIVIPDQATVSGADDRPFTLVGGSDEENVTVIGTVGTITGNGGSKLQVTSSFTDKTMSYTLKLTDVNGQYVQPAGTVTLQMSIPSAAKGKTLSSDKVKHTCNDGTVEELEIKNMDTYKTDGYIVCETSKFSSFEFSFEDVETEETTTEAAPAVSEETTTEASAVDTQPADDGNQPTGVALAVIPAIVAAAGIVISKKRG